MPGTRVDPHVKVLDDRVRSVALERGLDAVVYAPHFTPWPEIVDRANRHSDAALVVVPAREVFTGSWRDRRHVLALGLTDPVPDFLDLETTMAALREQDACIVAPHPAFLTMSLSAADVAAHRDDIDAVEVYNPKFLPWHGGRARRIAADVGRPTLVSSYAHLRGTVGTASVELAGRHRTPEAIVAAIRAGEIVDHHIAPARRRWPHVAAELAHLGWENTGQKARRVLAPGAEGTHPSAPVYEGRFDAGAE